jgi:Ricin-type beta-trefoil lectin domain/Alpha-L-arabinofuranosidase B, catalytic
LHQEGGIVMGVGGDNSKWSVGSFFEGAMTSGTPSDATENSVQANIVAAGYSGNSNGGAAGTITGPATKCVDVAGDDTGGNGTAVQLWDCQAFSVDQHWTYNGDTSLSTLGRCLDIIGNGTANGTQVELWDCNGVGGQKWTPQTDGSLRNPQSGRCLDSPGGATANGARLQIWDCNGTGAQKFAFWTPGVVFYQDINFGGAASAPIAKGDYAVLPAGIPNDWMSSLRVPAGWTVQAYEHGSFGGAVCTHTGNSSWVGPACNDVMSSFRIH